MKSIKTKQDYNILRVEDKEKFWNLEIEEYFLSDTSVREFSREKFYSDQQFGYWKTRLNKVRSSSPSKSFKEVKLIEPEITGYKIPEKYSLELITPSGLKLIIRE